MGFLTDLLAHHASVPVGEWIRNGLGLGALMGVGTACRWLLKQTSRSDDCFVENLKAVDTESLVRWYHSGQCRSYPVLYGVLRQRGISVRP